jgi:hypothetical protein
MNPGYGAGGMSKPVLAALDAQLGKFFARCRLPEPGFVAARMRLAHE